MSIQGPTCYRYIAEVPDGGYRWDDAPDGPRLVPVGDGRRPAEADPAAFAAIAALALTSDAVRAAAARYGPVRVGPDGCPDPAGDRLADWAALIAGLAGAVAAWGLAADPDPARLEACVRPDPRSGWVVDTHPGGREGDPARVREWVGPDEAHGDGPAARRQAAAACLWRLVGGGLGGHAAGLRAAAGPPGRPAVEVLVPSVGGWAWVGLAAAAAAGRVPARCGACGRVFPAGPDAARPHSRYCSTGCRSKGYRGRREEARRLFAGSGRTAADIAAALGCTPAAVARWLATGGPDAGGR